MKLGWITLNVKDLDKSLAFYENIVGLKTKRTISPSPGTEIVFLGFDENGAEIELIRKLDNPDPEYGRDISIGFEVASLDKMISKLDSQKIGIEGPYQPGPMIKFVYIKDPDGLKIQFYENMK